MCTLGGTHSLCILHSERSRVAEENCLFPVCENNVYGNMCVLANFMSIKICWLRKKLSSKVKPLTHVVLGYSSNLHYIINSPAVRLVLPRTQPRCSCDTNSTSHGNVSSLPHCKCFFCFHWCILSCSDGWASSLQLCQLHINLKLILSTLYWGRSTIKHFF